MRKPRVHICEGPLVCDSTLRRSRVYHAAQDVRILPPTRLFHFPARLARRYTSSSAVPISLSTSTIAWTAFSVEQRGRNLPFLKQPGGRPAWNHGASAPAAIASGPGNPEVMKIAGFCSPLRGVKRSKHPDGISGPLKTRLSNAKRICARQNTTEINIDPQIGNVIM